MSKDNPKDNKISVEDLEHAEHRLTEEETEAVIEAGECIIDAACQVVEQVGGDETDTMQMLSMALGLYVGRTGLSRGLMLDYLLDWYDQGVAESEEIEEGDPIIEVVLEGTKN